MQIAEINEKRNRQILIDAGVNVARLISSLLLMAVCLIFAFPVPLEYSGVSKIVEWMSVHEDSQRVFLLECALMAVCCAAFALGALLVDRRYWIGYCALMAFCMLAIIQAKSPLGLFMATLPAVVPLAIGSAPRARSAVIFVIALVLFSNDIVACVSWLLHYHQFHTPGFGDRACGLWKSPCTFYPITIISCLFFISKARLHKNANVRIFYFIFAVMSGVLLILTFTRSAWTGILFAVICSAALRVIEVKKRYLFALTAATLASFLARASDHVHVIANDRAVAGRIVIWKESIRLIRNAPWFGYGQGGFRSFEQCDAVLHSSYMPNQAVSLYLNTAVDYGGIGLALFILFCACSLYYLVEICKNTNDERNQSQIPLIAFGSLLAILFAGITDTTILGEPTRIPASVLLLTLAGLCYQRHDNEGSKNAHNDVASTAW